MSLVKTPLIITVPGTAPTRGRAYSKDCPAPPPQPPTGGSASSSGGTTKTCYTVPVYGQINSSPGSPNYGQSSYGVIGYQTICYD